MVERSRATKLRELGAVLVLFSAMVFVIVRSYTNPPEAEPTPTPDVVAAAVTPTVTPVPGQLTLKAVPPKVTSDTSADFTYAWSGASDGAFECRLDASSFAPCDPAGQRYADLSQGVHTFQVRVIRSDGEPTDAISYGWTVDRSAPEVTFFPEGGTYAAEQRVAIQSSKTGTIYYTTDGSPPSIASRRYSAPIEILADTTLQAISVDEAGNVSRVARAEYAFAPRFADDFEEGSLDRWSSVELLAIDQEGGLDSAHSARATSTDGTPAFAVLELTQPVSDIYIQSAVLLRSRGNNPVSFVRLRDSSNDILITLYVTSTGRLGLQLANAQSVASDIDVVANQWDEIQLHVSIEDGRTVAEVWFNGAYVEELHVATSLTDHPVGAVQLGESADQRVYDVAYDNFAVDQEFIPSAFLIITGGADPDGPTVIGSPPASPVAFP